MKALTTLWVAVAALALGGLIAVLFFVKHRHAERAARETAARDSAKKGAFMIAAMAADDAWMQANDQAQANALKRGDKVEFNRLFKEKGDRLSVAKGDLFEYLRTYYPNLWRMSR